MLNNENVEKFVKQCKNCTVNYCPERTIVLYIDDVGLDYFRYQMNHDKLPKSIRSAIVQTSILSNYFN